MATLYEIDAAIMDCVDTETGEIIDEEQLNALLMERSAKLEGVALWIKNLDSDAAAIRAEREALEKRQKAAEKKQRPSADGLQKHSKDRNSIPQE